MKHLFLNLYFEIDLNGYKTYRRDTRWGCASDKTGLDALNFFVKIFYRFYTIYDFDEYQQYRCKQ